MQSRTQSVKVTGLVVAVALLLLLLAACGTPRRIPPQTGPKGLVSFAVFCAGTEPSAAESLSRILSGPENRWPVRTYTVIEDAVASKADVLVLMHAGHGVGDDTVRALENRRIVSIGCGGLFDKLGLEIRSGACASSDATEQRIRVVENDLALGHRSDAPIVALRIPEAEPRMSTSMMYIPRLSHLRSVVDVIARCDGDENYAPIVRQGNHIMIGLDAPPDTWTPEYRDLFRDIALSLGRREVEPFSVAHWEVTRPGTYDFELAKGRSTEALSGRSFYFRFPKPTGFSARLAHRGSNSLMLMFSGERSGEHGTRKDAHKGEPLEISIDINEEDIRRIGERYWRLWVTNFDRAHKAECSLVIEYRE